MLNPRLVNIAGFLVCAALLGYALYAQFQLNLDPCPLCIFSRITVLALGVAFLLGAVFNPRGAGWRWCITVLIALTSLTAIGVSARHVYIQAQPAGSVPACGAPLDVLMQMFQVWTVIYKVLHGGGECAEVNWRFLGLAMPAWVLVFALVLGIVGTLANRPPKKKRMFALSSVEQPFQHSHVHAMQAVDIGQPHMLIDLVDSGIHHTQFHDLGP